jgi:hypothetical protein
MYRVSSTGPLSASRNNYQTGSIRSYADRKRPQQSRFQRTPVCSQLSSAQQEAASGLYSHPASEGSAYPDPTANHQPSAAGSTNSSPFPASHHSPHHLCPAPVFHGPPADSVSADLQPPSRAATAPPTQPLQRSYSHALAQDASPRQSLGRRGICPPAVPPPRPATELPICPA